MSRLRTLRLLAAALALAWAGPAAAVVRGKPVAVPPVSVSVAQAGPILSAAGARATPPPLPIPALLRSDAPAAAAGRAAIPPIDLAGARHVVFDVRGSRGGHGDVAAGYLTAADIVDRKLSHGETPPKITFIADTTERDILSRMTGGRVFDGAKLLGDHATVYEAESVPAAHPRADAFLTLAAQGGGYMRSEDLKFAEDPSGRGHIPVDGNTVFLTQPVFGNTEALSYDQAQARVGDKRLEADVAGLRRSEAGVYADPVARRMARMSRDAIYEFLLEEVPVLATGGQRILRTYLEGRALAGAQPALAYGISAEAVKDQFESYLHGLSARAARERTSFVVFTPSRFLESDLSSEALKERVHFVDSEAIAPEVATPGKVYMVRTGTLPHALFVGLMAWSVPPPVVAGDGAMSAAIALRRPFVLTKVEHNEENVLAFARRLSARADENARALIVSVFGDTALKDAQHLDRYASLFAATSHSIPLLTDAIARTIRAARALRGGAPTEALMEDLRDAALRSSVLTHKVMDGDAEARELAAVELFHGDDRSRKLLAANLAKRAAERFPVLKPLAFLGFPLLDRWLARFALRRAR